MKLVKIQNGSSASGGIGLFGLTFLILFTLKLLNVAPVGAWSWWIITAPLWGGWAFIVIVVVVLLLLAAWLDS